MKCSGRSRPSDKGGGGGGGEVGGLFRLFGPQFGLKIRGRGGKPPPGPPHLDPPRSTF